MRERRLHVSTALLPVKDLPSPLIEKSGWTTKAGWTFGEDRKPCQCPWAKPRFIGYPSHSQIIILTELLRNDRYFTFTKEPGANKKIVIYRLLVGRSEWDLLNIFACCVDLSASRLYGYGWHTVAYFHTKLREIRPASVQVVGRDTHTTCIIVIVWVNILVLSKESEPKGNLTFPVQRSCYLLQGCW
jgi:hypothetical protein